MLRKLLFVLIIGLLCGVAAAQESTPEPLLLDETFTAEDSAFSFSYPADWLLDAHSASGAVFSGTLATNEDALEKNLFREGSVFETGDAVLEIGIATRAYFASLLTDMTDETTLGGILELLLAAIPSSPLSGFKVEPTVELTVGDYPAALITLSTRRQGEGSLLLVDYGANILGGYVLNTALGEREALQPTVNAIAESFTLAEIDPEATLEPSALPLTESITTADGRTTVQVPAEWVTSRIATFGVNLANTGAALNRSLQSTFQPGEVQIFVAVDTIARLTPTLNLGVPADADALTFVEGIINAMDSVLTFGEPETLTLGELPAARVHASSDGLEGQSLVIELGDNVIGIVQVLTAPGELAQWLPTAQAVAESIVYEG